AEELQRLLKAQLAVRDQADQLFRRRAPHVRELLLLGRIDVHVLGAAVLAHDHALVDLLAGADEHRPALLQVEQREPRAHPPPGTEAPSSIAPDRTASARWHATSRPGSTSRSAGTSVLHRSKTIGQRGWNGHPGGGFAGSGSIPGS